MSPTGGGSKRPPDPRGTGPQSCGDEPPWTGGPGGPQTPGEPGPRAVVMSPTGGGSRRLPGWRHPPPGRWGRKKASLRGGGMRVVSVSPRHPARVSPAEWASLVGTGDPCRGFEGSLPASLFTDSEAAQGLPVPVLPGAAQAAGMAGASQPSSGLSGAQQHPHSLTQGPRPGLLTERSAWALVCPGPWPGRDLPGGSRPRPRGSSHLSVKPSGECLCLTPSEPHLFTVTSVLFLELFRLFQVVGKIDDTLALLNLVSLCFGSWARAPPSRSQGRWSALGVQGWPHGRPQPHPLPPRPA